MVGIQLLFVLGGFLQGVKLLVIEGIPWTKTWALLYIISFIFLSALRYISRNEDQEEDPPHQGQCTTMIVYLAILVQIVLWRWTTLDLIISKDQVVDLTFSKDQVVDLVLLAEVFLLSSFVAIFFDLDTIVAAKIAAEPIVVSNLLPLLIGIGIWHCCGPFAFVFYFSYFLPPVALYLLRYTGLYRGTVIRDLDNIWSMVIFLSPIINFILAWLWYTKQYDPSTTYKPGWVDKLG